MNFTKMSSAPTCYSINMCCDGPLTSSIKGTALPLFSSAVWMRDHERLRVGKGAINTTSRVNIMCSAAPESPTATVSETKKISKVESEAPAAKPKRAAPAKAPAKSLSQMIEEDVIPSLRTILEAQQDISQVELSYQDNRLEGSFLKKGVPYCFWAFFPNGDLTGPKGFSLSSYGSAASTIEPFLIDEKKITAKHVVFWVEKRLAAQGILPLVNA